MKQFRIFQLLFRIALLCFFLSEVKAQDSLTIIDSLRSYGIMPKYFQPSVKLHITQKKCDHNTGFISLGDGIASCINCGRSFIYDSTLFFRPLHIFTNDSIGIGTEFKTDLHIKQKNK